MPDPRLNLKHPSYFFKKLSADKWPSAKSETCI